jgi:nucleotide-binding universal stress UspA family protein
MGYRSLLVLLDQDANCQARTEIALRLARDLDCHLTGLAPTGIVVLPPHVGAASLGEASRLAWNALRAQAQDCCTAFEAACRGARLRSFDAAIEQGDRASAFSQFTKYCDLGISSQADPDALRRGEGQAFIDHVVLQSARPSLLIPVAGTFPSIGDNVLVTWDESREAARALADALPLLRRARTIRIVSWQERGVENQVRRRGFRELNAWLQRHGLVAETRIDVADDGIGEAIQSHVADAGADLIVMGAYGHARWAEGVFGGATRDLPSSMTVR